MKKISVFLMLTLFIISCSRKQSVVLLIVAGQSNAMGVGDSIKSVLKKFPCFEYNSKLDSFTLLKDPVGQDDLGFQQAKTGSFIPSLAYNYAEYSGNEVYVVQTAKGGTALHEKAELNNWGNWSDNGILLGNSKIKIDSTIAKLKSLHKKEIDIAIIWSQGENDGEAIGKNKLSKEEYENSLKELISKYRKKYGSDLPFIIIETGNHTSCIECDAGYKEVREIQRKVANDDPFTYIGYNETKDFKSKNWLKDPVHYNQEALNDIGKKLAQFIDNNIF